MTSEAEPIKVDPQSPEFRAGYRQGQFDLQGLHEVMDELIQVPGIQQVGVASSLSVVVITAPDADFEALKAAEANIRASHPELTFSLDVCCAGGAPVPVSALGQASN